MPVTQRSSKLYLLFSHTQCFWVFNIVGPDAPFDSGDWWDACSSVALPLMPRLIWVLRKYSSEVGCWTSQIKKWRDQSQPFPTGLASDKDLKWLRGITENSWKITLLTPKASKLDAGWNPPPTQGRIPIQHSPCRFTLCPGRMGTSLPSHMAPCLFWALDEKEIMTVITSLHPKMVCS